MITLIHACVHSRIDYYNTVLGGAPRTVTDKLQHVLNAAVHVISGTGKFDRGLRQLLAVGLLLSLAQQSGTVYRILSGTRESALTLSDVCAIVSGDTSACSALQVDNFMRYIC